MLILLVPPQVSYFFVTSGIAYDIIQEPPAFGAEQDPKTGGIFKAQCLWCKYKLSLAATQHLPAYNNWKLGGRKC